MPGTIPSSATNALRLLTQQALQALDQIQTLAQQGSFHEANTQLTAVQGTVRELCTGLDEHRAKTNTLHRVLATRSASYEADLGLLKQQQQDLDRQIGDIDARLAQANESVYLTERDIQQLAMQMDDLQRRLHERRQKLEELKRWAWVPGYGAYLAIRTLVDGDIQEERNLMERLGDKHRELIHNHEKAGSANELRQSLDAVRQQMLRSNLGLSQANREISDMVASVRALVEFLGNADAFWLSVQQLGVLRTAEDLQSLLAITSQLEQRVPEALAQELHGAACSFRQALVAVSDAVQGAGESFLTKRS